MSTEWDQFPLAPAQGRSEWDQFPQVAPPGGISKPKGISRKPTAAPVAPADPNAPRPFVKGDAIGPEGVVAGHSLGLGTNQMFHAPAGFRLSEEQRNRQVAQGGDPAPSYTVPTVTAPIVNTMLSGSSIVSRGLEAVGLEQPGMADAINRRQDAIEQQADQDSGGSTIKRYVRGGIQSAMTALAAGATAGPAGAIGMFAAQAGNQGYTEAKDAGKTDAEAMGHAVRAAIVEGGIAGTFQALGLGGLENIAGRGIGGATLKEVGKRFGKQLVTQELPEELLTTVAENINRKYGNVNPADELNPDGTYYSEKHGFSPLAKTYIDTIGQTAVAMGLTTAPSAAKVAIDQNKRMRIPKQLGQVASWVDANPDAAARLADAARAAKPISQSMMDQAGLYRGNDQARARFATQVQFVVDEKAKRQPTPPPPTPGATPAQQPPAVTPAESAPSESPGATIAQQPNGAANAAPAAESQAPVSQAQPEAASSPQPEAPLAPPSGPVSFVDAEGTVQKNGQLVGVSGSGDLTIRYRKDDAWRMAVIKPDQIVPPAGTATKPEIPRDEVNRPETPESSTPPTEPPPPAFTNQNAVLGAITAAAPDLAGRYAASAGVKEGYTIADHSARVVDNVMNALTPEAAADIQDRTGMRVEDVMRFAAALHDIGKADAIKAGDKGRQHEFTGPLVRQVLDSAAAGEAFPFNSQERALIEALSANDPIGALIQGKIDARQAADQIAKLAEAVGVSPADYLTMQSAFYKADAGDYPSLKKSLFTKRANGREALNSPEYAALEELIYGEVREIPWMERFGGQGQEPGGDRSDRRKPQFIHGTAVHFDQFDEGKDRGANAIGPGVYLLAKEDQDVAEHYAARAMRGIMGMFSKASQKKLRDATPEFLKWHIRDLLKKSTAAEQAGDAKEATRFQKAAETLQAMLEGKIGKKVVDVDFDPGRTLVLGAIEHGGAVIPANDLDAITGQIDSEIAAGDLNGTIRTKYDQALQSVPADERNRGRAVYSALSAALGSKADANRLLRRAGFGSIQFLHGKGNYTRPYNVLVGLEHQAAKVVSRPEAASQSPPADTPAASPTAAAEPQAAAEPAAPQPQADQRPLPEAIASLNDQGLTDFLVQIGALKRGLKLKPRAQLEALARDAVFGATPLKTIRFAKPEPTEPAPKAEATTPAPETTPVVSAEPPVEPQAATEEKSGPSAVEKPDAPESLIEPQEKEAEKPVELPPPKPTQPAKRTIRRAKPASKDPAEMLRQYDAEKGYDQIIPPGRPGYRKRKNQDRIAVKKMDARRAELVKAMGGEKKNIGSRIAKAENDAQVIRDFAEMYDLGSEKDFALFQAVLDDMHREAYALHVEREAAKKVLREKTQLNARQLHLAEAKNLDHDSFARLDEIAQDAWKQFELIPLGLRQNDIQQIWDIIKEGVIPPPTKTDKKLLRQSAEYARDLKDHRRDSQEHPSDWDIDTLAGNEAGVERGDRGGDAAQESDAEGVPGSDPVMRAASDADRQGAGEEGDLAGEEEGDTSFDPASFDFGDPAASDGFTLDREPAKRTVAEKFENAEGTQKKLISGMDLLPGQGDLFETDGPSYSLKAMNRRRLAERDYTRAFPGSKIERHPIEKDTFRVVLPNGNFIDVRQLDVIPIDWARAEKQLGRKIPAAERQEWAAHGSFTITLKSGVRASALGLMEIAKKIADQGTLRHEAFHVARDGGFFTPEELSLLIKKYSSADKSRAEQDEDIAMAREAWTGPKGLAQRIAAWIRDLLRSFGFGTLTATDVMRLMDTPAFWSRRANRTLSETVYQLKRNTPEYVASLANPGVSPKARKLIEEQKMAMPDRQQRADEKVFAEADKRLAEQGKEKALQAAFDTSKSNTYLDDVDAVIANRLLNEAAEAVTPDDKESIERLSALHMATFEKRSEWGRIGRMLRDPVESPAQRRQRILGEALFLPTEKIQKEIATEKKVAEREGREPVLQPIYDRNTAEITKAIETLAKEGVTPKDFAKAAESPKATIEMLGKITTTRASLADKMFEYWINSVLSGIPTQSRNLFGTAVNAAWYFTAEKLAEVGVNTIARRERGARLGEVKYAYGAMLASLSKAANRFVAAWQSEIDTFDAAMRGGAQQRLWEEQGRRAIGGTWGRVVRAPSRLMLAVDVFMKTMISHGVAAERGYRLAKAEGLEGADIGKRVKQLMDQPDSPVWREAIDKARELAFQQEGSLLSPSIKRGLGVLRQVPGGRYLLPFVKTMINIFSTGLKKSPLGLVDTVMKIHRGETAHITADVAQQVIAMAFMYAIFGQDEDDPWITGSKGYGGTGEHRYSIRIGDTWVYYGWIEPFATAAGVTIDSVRAFKDTPTEKIPAMLFGAFTGQLKAKTFNQSIADIIEALEQGEGGEAKLIEWAAKFGTSWMPNIVRSTGREMDDVVMNRRVRGIDGAEFGKRLGKRFVQNLELGVQDVVPGMEDLPRFDIWGRTLPKSQSPVPGTDLLWRMLAPVATTKDEPFIGTRFMAAWKNRHPEDLDKLLYPPRPTYTVNGETKSMTDEQEAEHAKFAGQVAAKLVERGGYDPENPTQEQWDAFLSDFEEARRVAKQALVDQWTGKGPKASLEADAVAAAIAKKNRIDAVKTLRRVNGSPDRVVRRPGESLIQYRKRREADVADAAEARALLSRVKG